MEEDLLKKLSDWQDYLLMVVQLFKLKVQKEESRTKNQKFQMQSTMAL